MTPGETLTEQVLVRVEALDRPHRVRPDLTAILVLDVSGSMGGAPLAQVIRSGERIIELLGPNDALGVVTFASRAACVAPVRRLDARGRQDLRRALQALAAGGGTNMGAGIGEASVCCPPRRKHARHVALLLSDGHANEGATSHAALAGLAQAARENGLAISTLGYGLGHDEDALAAVADAAGGRYAFVPDPALADGCFARALGAQRDIVAEDLQLLLSPARGVEIERVLGSPRVVVGDRGMKVMLPDAVAPDVLHLVVQLRVEAPRECGRWRPLELALSGRSLPDLEPFVLCAAAETTVSRERSEPNRDVLVRAAIALTAEARVEARAAADRGNYRAAATALEALKARLEAIPGFVADDGSDLAEAYQALLDDISAYAQHPDPEAYRAYRKASAGYTDMSGGTRGGGYGPIAGSPSGRAYAAQLGEALPPAHLVMLGCDHGASIASIDQHEVVLGRSRQAHIRIADPSVTRHHAIIRFAGGTFWLLDLGGTNTTTVNGEPVHSMQALIHGDVVGLGAIRIEFRFGPPQ
jgi:uncharacterized protein YegL